jgi:hypothetical protein
MIKLQARNLVLISMVGVIGLFSLITEAKTGTQIRSLHDLKALDEVIQSSGTDYTQSDFFTISDFQENIKKIDSFQNPLTLGIDFFVKILSKPPEFNSSQSELSLLNWAEQHEDSHSIDKYVRQKHFGSWIKDPSRETCLNTRGEVLVRDSLDPVEYDTKNKCRVSLGRWHDPYTGKDFTNADDLQIDHVVPLKNAYTNGAWGWSSQERCLYANFLKNSFHLMPVSGHENMAKSDSSPDKYIPPNPEFTCKYIENWLKIKAIWKLHISLSEADGIRQLIEDNNCQKTEFFMTEDEITEQRNGQQDIPSACLN